MLNTIIIQPPLVQLNTPYPSGAYLKSFFQNEYSSRKISGKVEWLDLSNEFFHAIFCREGLQKIFAKTTSRALKMAQDFENKNDERSAFELRRFVSLRDAWCDWINQIVALVCPNPKISGREFAHEFIRGSHVPRGARIENYLQSLDRDVSTDDAQILASLALADLADYITTVYDNNFALIRYAEHLASSTSDFEKVLRGLSSPALEDFYKPLLFQKLLQYKNEPTLFGISVPFPGCFEAAVFTADFIRKENFCDATIAFGGGYINTELREIDEIRLFDFCDFLSYDKGYGSFIEFLDCVQILKNENLQNLNIQTENINSNFQNQKMNFIFDGTQFYNTTYRFKNKIILPRNNNLNNSIENLNKNSVELSSKNSLDEKSKSTLEKERNLVHKITPDYSAIDFSRYPRLSDDKNPMHRIWNDGAWLKAYIAHGCYWHRCAFCDTTLDYVKDYCLTNVDNLFLKLYEQAKKIGVYGIHFVDEACPPKSLEKFALKNLSLKNAALKNSILEKSILQNEEVVLQNESVFAPFTFWGNIRFEKTFSRDLADLLSAGGLTAVSAGIEIATGTGLNSVNKGTDMENIVSACCAFKEAGILIHSYMIFGFWNQSAQDLIDSMETLRQMFEAGLLDSAFWHKFVLTRHSTVFQEVQNGKYPALKILPQKKSQFAKNDLHFEGEEKSEKYSAPLNIALESWMHGEKLNQNVETFFPFKMPRPSIKKNYVESLIQKYEEKKERDFSKIPDASEKSKFVWLGGAPLILDSKNGQVQLCWSYMGELLYADCKKDSAQKIVEHLTLISVKNYDSIINSDSAQKENFLGNKILDILGKKLFLELRGKGLCKLL